MIIGPFLFDGPARPNPFFDRPHTGWAKMGRAGPFATHIDDVLFPILKFFFLRRVLIKEVLTRHPFKKRQTSLYIMCLHFFNYPEI